MDIPDQSSGFRESQRLYRFAKTGNFYVHVQLRGKEIRLRLKTADYQLTKRRLRDFLHADAPEEPDQKLQDMKAPDI